MNASLVCIADLELLRSRAKALNLKLRFKELKSLNKAEQNKKGTIQFFQIAKCIDCTPCKLNPENAQYIIQNLHY